MSENSIRSSELLDFLRECPNTLAAEMLQVNERTIRTRIKAGRYSSPKRGRVDLMAAFATERAAAEKQSAVSIATARLRRAQTERLERENAEAAENLLTREEGEEAIELILAAITRALEKLPVQVAKALAGKDGTINTNVVAILERETRQIQHLSENRLRGVLSSWSGAAC